MIASSTNMCALTPKPPPTAGATTRIFASDTPSGPETLVFRKWGIWVELQIVNSPRPLSYSAMTPRPSRGTPE